MMASQMMILACALVPAGTLAAPTSQVHALRQQVAALQLDQALNLTQQQAQALLPLLQTAQAQMQGLKAQRAVSQPALVAALTQAVADLKAKGTVSASTVQAVRAARVASPQTLRQDIKSLWQQAKQVLTADQLEALQSVRLGIRPPTSNAGVEAAGRPRSHRLARRFLVTRTLLSEPFVALVQARAG
jgi:hypothetical protein